MYKLKIHLFGLLSLLFVGFVSSSAFAAPAADLLSVEYETKPRTVVLPNNETAELSTKINYAYLSAPQKGLNNLSRVKHFANYMAAKELDAAWAQNREASNEAFIVPYGTADEVFKNINNIVQNENWLKSKFSQIARRVKGTKPNAAQIFKVSERNKAK